MTPPSTTAAIPRIEGAPDAAADASWHANGYDNVMSTAPSDSTISQLRAFFSTDEAPIRVTLVILVTAIGVLMVAFDTAERSKAVPPASSQQAAMHR